MLISIYGTLELRIAITVLATSILMSPALAGDISGVGGLPAVSGVNAKASVEGGHLYDDEGVLGLGSLSMPIAHSYGVQFDGALGSIDGETLGGGAVHLFRRDPASYLLGVYASYHTWDDIDIWRVAGEVELYLGRVSVEGLIGVEGIDVPNQIGGLDVFQDDDEHLFAIADVAYYLTDNFRISGGYRYVAEESLGRAEAEYLFASQLGSHSVFVSGQFGDSDLDRITGGIRFYLGADPSKSLIRRHREDDPANRVPDFVTLDVVPPVPPPAAPPPPPPSDEEEPEID